ncbi:MAG: ribonuclease R, partial [Gammaproteobacteria bacterium]|nr:ribonuclease R [Gammaproteobacteria bacterium]
MPRKKQASAGARRKKDPHARREAARYDKPIASRELIIDVITEADRPLDRDELRELLGIHGEEAVEALRRRLKAMTRDGQLVCNRRNCYAPVDRLDLVAGRVIGHRDGFGFLVP